MTADFRDRQYISQNATDTVGLAISIAGAPGDADGNIVQITMLDENTSTQVFQREATRAAQGLYETALLPAESATPGPVTFIWQYDLNSVPQEYRTYAYIGESAPAYDALSPTMKDVVDNVWIRFADLFDSPDGGPNLQTYFQSNYARGRVAQLLRVAVGLLNTTAQPYQTYTLDDGVGGGSFPVQVWGSLLESALYVECLKHLRRSYVEQPAVVGANGITRLDRRDYMQRWGEVLRDEQAQLKAQLDVFKISNMGLGRPKVLVSGGVFGRFGPTRVAGSIAARPRYWTRFYSWALIAACVSLGPWQGHSSSDQHHPQNSSTRGSGVVSISQEA